MAVQPLTRVGGGGGVSAEPSAAQLMVSGSTVMWGIAGFVGLLFLADLLLF